MYGQDSGHVRWKMYGNMTGQDGSSRVEGSARRLALPSAHEPFLSSLLGLDGRGRSVGWAAPLRPINVCLTDFSLKAEVPFFPVGGVCDG